MEIEKGAPLRLVVDPAEVGFFEFIPSIVKLVDEPNCTTIIPPLAKGDKTVREVKFLPLTVKRITSLALTAVAAPRFSILSFKPVAAVISTASKFWEDSAIFTLIRTTSP